MNYPNYDAQPLSRVLGEVSEERARQDAQWGEQNHPDGTGSGVTKYLADSARRTCQEHERDGTVTWYDIFTEEWAEAMAEKDPVKLRVELIQAAAVAVAWVEAIDRRSA